MSEQKQLYKVAGYKEDDRITNPLYNMAVKGKLPDGLLLEKFLGDICVGYEPAGSFQVFYLRDGMEEYSIILHFRSVFGMCLKSLFISAEQATYYLQKIFTEKWKQFLFTNIQAVFGNTVREADTLSSYLVNESMILWALMDNDIYAHIVMDRKINAIKELRSKFYARGQWVSLMDAKAAIEFVYLMRPVHPEEE